MREILIDTLKILIVALINSIGLVALSIAFQSNPNELIHIPALIISWIVLYPSYKFWLDKISKLFTNGDGE
jgi:flagellar biosynthesis protein FliQ